MGSCVRRGREGTTCRSPGAATAQTGAGRGGSSRRSAKGVASPGRGRSRLPSSWRSRRQVEATRPQRRQSGCPRSICPPFRAESPSKGIRSNFSPPGTEAGPGRSGSRRRGPCGSTAGVSGRRDRRGYRPGRRIRGRRRRSQAARAHLPVGSDRWPVAGACSARAGRHGREHGRHRHPRQCRLRQPTHLDRVPEHHPSRLKSRGRA